MGGRGGGCAGGVRPPAGRLQSDQVLQEQLIRRRLGRMRELQSLYRDQYWRSSRRFAVATTARPARHGRGGRKEEAAAEMAEQAEEGVSSKCAHEDCDERPMPLSGWCFAHILSDPKQQLYALPRGGRRATTRRSGPKTKPKKNRFPRRPSRIARTRRRAHLAHHRVPLVHCDTGRWLASRTRSTVAVAFRAACRVPLPSSASRG